MAFHITSTVPHQVAEHLRKGLLNGRWTELMPGRDLLAAELGLSPRSIQGALEILEQERLLISQGPGRRRKIKIPKNYASPALRIQFLLYDHNATKDHYIVGAIHELREAGHHAEYSSKTLRQMEMDEKQVARLVKKTEANAWVVCAASHEILKWFSLQETPAFALFGSIRKLPLAGAGPYKAPALAAATQCLVDHGHQRISLLIGHTHRFPKPNRMASDFLDILESTGIKTGAYNLPDWEESAEGFEAILESLFGGPTPPTALIVAQPNLYHAAHHYLARHGLKAPQHVSLVCTDSHPDFAWCKPTIAHIQWDENLVVRHILRWAVQVARGKNNRRKNLTNAKFIEGDSIGPVNQKFCPP